MASKSLESNASILIKFERKCYDIDIEIPNIEVYLEDDNARVIDKLNFVTFFI